MFVVEEAGKCTSIMKSLWSPSILRMIALIEGSLCVVVNCLEGEVGV